MIATESLLPMPPLLHWVKSSKVLTIEAQTKSESTFLYHSVRSQRNKRSWWAAGHAAGRPTFSIFENLDRRQADVRVHFFLRCARFNAHDFWKAEQIFDRSSNGDGAIKKFCPDDQAAKRSHGSPSFPEAGQAYSLFLDMLSPMAIFQLAMKPEMWHNFDTRIYCV